MMDLNILVVILCVLLTSLGSLLFINKFLRRKTFEEVIAEKKALTEKLYAQNKSTAKKPKKVQSKKEMKREKKQRQKEQQRDTTEQEDSDGHSEQPSVEDEPEGLSKTHVEFEPDPEIVTFGAENPRRASNADREPTTASANLKLKSKKEKKNARGGGILLNKNEPIAIKENPNVEESLNNFEAKPPKDVVELKKSEKEEKQSHSHGGKKERNAKNKNSNDKASASITTAATNAVSGEQPIEIPHVAKEIKQQDEKLRQVSPKIQSTNNKNKQQIKKQNKESAAAKELVQAMDKLSDTDTIGVSLLMNLFRRAELNRSEIQILIDYLLNKQQDMPVNHSEWSDDVCQKLKRQLEEKDRALQEQQEASIGIQAKLRELRAEINAERMQMNATIKAYAEKLQAKEQEIAGLNQEMQSLNEKFTVERQKFQTKLLHEKQTNSQDLLSQLQMMQGEMSHKDNCIADLTRIVNASRQAVEESQQRNEIIQNQSQQIRALEQQRDELEQLSNNQVFELEKAKTLETENAEYKVEVRNLQNALESAKTELTQLRNDLEAATSEASVIHNVELNEKQNMIQALQSKNAELSQQLANISNQTEEQKREQSDLQVTLDALRAQLTDKERQLAEFSAKNAELLQHIAEINAHAQAHAVDQQELHKLIEKLQGEIAGKHNQLQGVEQNAQKFGDREKELLQQLQEQKEKNNDLRMKNWKLVEALQNAETTLKQNRTIASANANLVLQEQLIAATQKSANAPADPAKDQTQIRELFQRLYPDAVAACAGTALSLPFDQWIEQILATHIKQSISKANTTSCSNKSTQSNRTSVNSVSSNTNHNSAYSNSHTTNNNNVVNNNELTNNSNNSRVNDSNSSTNSSVDNEVEMQKLHTQNAQLRVQIDELTKLVTKTSNTLSELEGRAREQDEHWRGIVREKDDLIYSLQHSNGQQDI